MSKHKFYIGTSGFHYKHWIGTFYPEGTKDAEQLKYYIRYFDTVELNNPFYRLPSRETFEGWKDSVPKDFIFSVKASRFITHMKKLKDPGETLKEFMKNSAWLGNKLGPVLFQLPPRWKLNAERLEEFLEELPRKHRYVFEFRDASWYAEEVCELLRRHNCAFCIYELAGHLTPMEVTADFVYIRLHGPGDKYQGSYSNKTLQQWNARCHEWLGQGKDVFIYFDNDQAGYAAFNARYMRELNNAKTGAG